MARKDLPLASTRDAVTFLRNGEVAGGPIGGVAWAQAGLCRPGPFEVSDPVHRHFLTVMVVPCPTAVSISNSSINRRTPERPRPSPPELE